MIVSVTTGDLVLGKSCGPPANPVARAIAGHIREEMICHATFANDKGHLTLCAPSHLFLPGYGVGASGYSEDSSSEERHDFPLSSAVCEKMCHYLRGGYLEPFEFECALPEVFTVPPGYVPRLKLPCYPGVKDWNPKGAYATGDVLSPLRRIH